MATILYFKYKTRLEEPNRQNQKSQTSQNEKIRIRQISLSYPQTKTMNISLKSHVRKK